MIFIFYNIKNPTLKCQILKLEEIVTFEELRNMESLIWKFKCKTSRRIFFNKQVILNLFKKYIKKLREE